MKKQSAGIMAWKMKVGKILVLIVHPGGPFFAKKNVGAWSIPKGEYGEEEEPLCAAKWEFAEELGITVEGKFVPLTPVKQKRRQNSQCLGGGGRHRNWRLQV